MSLSRKLTAVVSAAALALLGTGLASTSAAASPPSVYGITASFTAKASHQVTVLVSPDGATLYAVSSTRLDVIDAATRSTEALITLPGQASSAAVSPDGSKIYVGLTVKAAGEVAVVATATNTVTGVFPVATKQPSSLVVSADGSTVYTANQTDNVVRAYLTSAAHSALWNVTLREQVAGLTLSPDGSTLYVAAYAFLDPPGAVYAIATKTHSLSTLVSFPSQNVTGVTVSADGKTVYASLAVDIADLSFEDTIVAIDVTTGKQGSFRVWTAGRPAAGVLSPDGGTLFVPVALATPPYTVAEVEAIDLAVGSIIGAYPVGVAPATVAKASDATAPFAVYAGDSTDDITAIGQGLVLTTPARPAITGSRAVGDILSIGSSTAAPSMWGPPTVTLHYQWCDSRSGPIRGATARTLALTPSLLGQQVWAVVTGSTSRPGYVWTPVETNALTVAAGTLTSSTPTFTGILGIGHSLTAHPGVWTKGTTLSYQWYASGRPIAGASRSVYYPSAAQLGTKVAVMVTGRLPGYRTVAKISIAEKVS